MNQLLKHVLRIVKITIAVTAASPIVGTIMNGGTIQGHVAIAIVGGALYTALMEDLGAVPAPPLVRIWSQPTVTAPATESEPPPVSNP